MISISIAHCAKKKEEIQKDLVIQVITNGRWLVQYFSENTTDVSNEFTNYEFQFFENGTRSGDQWFSYNHGQLGW